jgi:hypothetical protein
MIKRDIIHNLDVCLHAKGYMLAGEHNQAIESQNATNNMLIKAGIGVAKMAVTAALGVHSHGSAMPLKAADNGKLVQALQPFNEMTELTAYKTVVADTIMICAVDGDEVLANDFPGAMDALYGVIDNVKKECTGLLRGAMYFIILFIFDDPAKSNEFQENYMVSLKKWELWKKTFTLPWVIDVTSSRVIPHSGPPWAMSIVLSAKYLEGSIFR